MKRIMTILIAVLAAGNVFAQGSVSEDNQRWANEWKYAFSKEGIKEWKPEFTLRGYAGFVTSGPMLTGGVRIDQKRSFSLFVGMGDTYIDHAPADIYTVSTGLNFRRYWHLGKRKVFALYSDLYAGAAFVTEVTGATYEINDNGEVWEIVEEKPGDVLFIGGWQPGVRIRFYRNLHIFLGPTIATDCIGAHFGIGF